MTVPKHSINELLGLARNLGAIGVEIRNDIATDPLLSMDAIELKNLAQNANLRILALAEVSNFNDGSDETFDLAVKLARRAKECGAEGIILIPAILDDAVVFDKALQYYWRERLCFSLKRLLPILAELEITGFVEPIGFKQSTLRFKSDLVAVIEDLEAQHRIKIVHDTFHHHLAAENTFFASHTGIVHISGVETPLETDKLCDHHRVLVGESDNLKNVAQMRQLIVDGFTGPFSFEAFSPEIHGANDPEKFIKKSQEFITAELEKHNFLAVNDDLNASKMEVPVFN